MIETRRLKNVVIFFQTTLTLVLSRKIMNRVTGEADSKINHNSIQKIFIAQN